MSCLGARPPLAYRSAPDIEALDLPLSFDPVTITYPEANKTMLTLGRNGQQVFSGSSMRKEAVCETRKVFFLQSRTLSHTETATVPVPLLLCVRWRLFAR